MQIDGPAQAGADSYGLQSGSGGGMGAPGSTGTCVGPNCGGTVSDAFYRRALSSALQERVQDNDKLNRQVFSAEVLITVSPAGNITAVQMVRSSGRQDRDDMLVATLRAIEGLDPPPANVRFPQRVTVRGRRSV
jgi:TonB family protein